MRDVAGDRNYDDDSDDQLRDALLDHDAAPEASSRQLARGTSRRRKLWRITREALPILALSLCSLMLSGELLLHLARWPVFVKVDKLFILVPILLNMKGNLEMNLSLRLSTSANMGELDVRRTRQALVQGNLALLQVQALIVSTFAGSLAFVLGVILPNSEFQQNARSLLSARRIIHGHPNKDTSAKLRNGYFEFVLVLATGTLAASISSAVLGSFMCALVILSRRFGVNPDNVASPLAASLGDLLTLVVMGLLGSLLVRFEGTLLATIILLALIAFCLVCGAVAWRNFYVRRLLSSGWTPLFVAMLISSGAGMVLDTFVQRYDGFALLAPVLCGLPGACTAIFASRISTALHSADSVGSGHPHHPHHHRLQHSNARAFWSTPTEGWLVPLTLAGLGFAITTVYITLVWATGQMHFGWPFAICFILAAGLAICIALSLSHFLCLFLWTRDYDPGE